MNFKNKNLSKDFLAVLVLIIIITLAAWWFWPNIKKLVLGDDYQKITVPQSLTTINRTLKQQVLSQLEKLRQYGEWPIATVRENPNRGDPFTPKQ